MAKSNKFGTFGGVFVPSILTILGVIMYLRLPMIVGEAGLWATLGIIVVAHIISVTTGLSVSSIATDRKVQAGGTYYMISRSLGLPIGGTLGIALFIGLSFSVSLYLIGFSESFLNYWGFSTEINNIRLTGTIILVAVTTLTFISTSLAIKTQYFIMAAIGLSLISILFGRHELGPVATNTLVAPSTAVPLMVLFGIFFPAVTGFEAGVSMSGDLKDPKKSIPTGSLMAIIVGFIVYVAIATFFYLTVDGNVLANDPQVLLKISWIPELVIAGIWGATLSSALGSILGAPRILQATAIDKISPKVFGRGFGPTNEPRNALLLTFLIAEIGILIGELDVIARVVSIFFITTYGFLNISATFEQWTSSDFRPEFKVSGWISLIGALACILVMIQLDFIAMIGAIIIMSLLFFYLKRKELSLDTGDAWSGVWASLVKTGLTRLVTGQAHTRNWRPNIIMFSGGQNTRKHLVEIGNAISGKLGILSAFELVPNEENVLVKAQSNLAHAKGSEGFFMHKLYCHDVYSGIDQISRVYGFSGVEPNTILMGWSTKPSNREKFMGLIGGLMKGGFSTVFLNYNKEKGFGNYKTIDIWWSGSGRNLSLAVNLIRFMTTSLVWNRVNIKVYVINNEGAEPESVYKRTKAILDDYRLSAEVEVVDNENDASDYEIIASNSGEADLTILGVPDRKFTKLEKYFDSLNDTIVHLGSTLVINASNEFESHDVLDVERKFKETDEHISVSIPDLNISRFPEINAELLKIDENGFLTIDALCQKSFSKVYTRRISLLENLIDRLNALDSELKRMKDITETVKRKRAIDRIKGDLFYKLDNLVSEVAKDNHLENNTEEITSAITWYLDKLLSDFKRYPRQFTVAHPKEDYLINDSDTSGLKWLKRRKKFKHFFVGQPITNKIPYREVARYYQYNSRLIFLKEALLRFLKDEKDFYFEVRQNINSLSNYLDEIEEKIFEVGNPLETKPLLELLSQLENTKKKVSDEIVIQSARFKVEFRKNLHLMAHDMENIRVPEVLKKKVRSRKHYDAAKVEVAAFSGRYHREVRSLINKISLELQVNDVLNRQDVLFEEFYTELVQIVRNQYLRNLKTVITKLENNEAIDLKKVKFELDFDTELLDNVENHLSKIIGLSEHLPESVDISLAHRDQHHKLEWETTTVPVINMAEYYLKSRYEIAVEEAFTDLMESLKRSVFTAQDAVSLWQFNMENQELNAIDSKQEIYEACKEKLKYEHEGTLESLSGFRDIARTALTKSLEPLHPNNIEHSADIFISGLRSYQGKQVITGVSEYLDNVLDFGKKTLTKLWYFKSRTILRSGYVSSDPELNSTVSKMLDLKERLKPKELVIKSLPQYYIALFNGKSNIGRDFWIKRPVEEELFKKAVTRFNAGHFGGILIVGERNTGKTSFAKHVTQAHFKKDNVYSVFPPLSGTHSIEGFTDSMANGLQRRGELDQMVSMMPTGSVIIINDLELFWERSESGFAIIDTLNALIDEYGKKLLFIVNLNPHAFRIISQVGSFKDRFLEIIQMKGFEADELRELILKRHKSSGLTFSYLESDRPLNDLQTAALFDRYFSFSQGNPGTALNAWLTNIKEVEKEAIRITKPENPSMPAFKQLEDDWLTLLTQFVIHKRLTLGKIRRIQGWESPKASEILLALLRSGLIVEKSSDVYHLDTFVQPFIVGVLKEKGVLL